MATKEEIQAVIDAFNQAESEQAARLDWLYKAMRARKGGNRRIVFSNTQWGVNQFQVLPDYIALPMHVKPVERYITDWEAGED